jgi:hypothetical protein
MSLFMAAQDLASDGDLPKAMQALDHLERLLDGAGAAAAQPDAEAQQAEAPATTLSIWQQAKELTDEQIGKLQAVFRQANDPLSLRIADQGLTGFTKNLQVGLQVALREFDQAAGDGRSAAAAKVQASSAKLRIFLQKHPAVPLLEKNPFGVPVTLRATLGAALDDIDKAVAR